MIIQPLVSQLVAAVFRLAAVLAGKDRRLTIIERRLRVLALARELKTAGLDAADLRRLERRLTKE